MQIPGDLIRLQRGPAHVALVAAVLAALVAGALGGSYAAFSGSTSNEGSTFSAKRIFPGDRSLSARDFRDASSGSAADRSDPLSFADGVETRSAANMAAGGGTYLDFELQAPLPAGLSVSGVEANVRIASQGGGGSGNACHWLELRSGGSTIATYGSEASPLSCSAGATQTTVTTPVPDVTSTDTVNGLTVRVHAWETGGKRVDVDMVTVTGSTPYAPFTVYERRLVDTSKTPASVTTWLLSETDGSAYTTAANWPTAPSSTRYVQRAYNLAVPVDAVITNVTLTRVWRPTVATETCYYVEVFQGSTPIATYGSAGAPAGCSSDPTSFTMDTLSLPAVDTPAKANDLVIRQYGWMNVPVCGGKNNPACGKWVTDEARVAVSYYLD